MIIIEKWPFVDIQFPMRSKFWNEYSQQIFAVLMSGIVVEQRNWQTIQ